MDVGRANEPTHEHLRGNDTCGTDLKPHSGHSKEAISSSRKCGMSTSSIVVVPCRVWFQAVGTASSCGDPLVVSKLQRCAVLFNRWQQHTEKYSDRRLAGAAVPSADGWRARVMHVRTLVTVSSLAAIAWAIAPSHRLMAVHAQRLQLQRLRVAICCVDVDS